MQRNNTFTMQLGLSQSDRWYIASRQKITERLMLAENHTKKIQHDMSTQVDPKRSPQLRWLEQRDTDSIFIENVDLANSQAGLAIPLVDVAVSPSLHIALSASYNSGDVSTNGLLGNGWNIHNIGQDYIFMDHQQSGFEDNQIYTLLLDGNPVNLIRSKSLDGVFITEDDPEVIASYDKQKSRWIVDTPNFKTVYGTPETGEGLGKAAYASLRWPNWRGAGNLSDESGLMEEDIAWYVVSREEKFGKQRKILYTYRIETSYTRYFRKPYTSTILLESIYDSENHDKLTVFYGTKDQNEFIEKQYLNTDGQIQFPVYLTNKHFIVGYHLETLGYHQQLQFGYYVDTLGIRTLSEVYQIFNENGGKAGERETIFKISYMEVEARIKFMTKLEVPSYQSSLSYEYKKLSLPLMKFGRKDLDEFSFPTVENVQLKQADDYGLMAYNLGTGGVYVQIMNRQLTKRSTGQLLYTGSRQSALNVEDKDDPKKIQVFEVIAFKYVIAVLQASDEGKKLYLFHRNKDTDIWPVSATTSIGFPKEAKIRHTEKFIIVSPGDDNNTGKLFLYQPVVDRNDNYSDGYKSFILRTQCGTCKIERLCAKDGTILAYDGETLYGWKENYKTGQWDRKIILKIRSNEKEMFKHIVLKDDLIEMIREKINNNGLHIVDTMILLSVVEYKGGSQATITTNAHLLLVGNNLEIRKQEVKEIHRERVPYLYSERNDLLDDGTWLLFEYNWSSDFGGRFRVQLVDIWGTTFNGACKESKNKFRCKNELLKSFNEEPSFIEGMRGMVLFDTAAMTSFQLDVKGAKTSTDIFEMTGTGWIKNSYYNSSVIKLGNNFRINTITNENRTEATYQLFRQNPANGGTDGGKIATWKISFENSAMSIGYPSYICMQPDVKRGVQLLPLRERGLSMEPISLGQLGERVLEASNHEILVTMMNFADPLQPANDKKIIVRRVNSLVESAPLWVLSKSEVQNQHLTRVRTYQNEYKFETSTKSQKNIVRVIPSGDKNVAGYYEEITVIPVEFPLNATKTLNYYDVNDQLASSKDVQESIDRQRQSISNEDPTEREWYKIWDVSQELVIAHTSPYKRTDNSVAYFGFEDYENNTVPVIYPNTSLIRTEVAFTGTNFVRLRKSESIKLSLMPNNQQQTYVASTWLRHSLEAGKKYSFNSPSPNVQANIITHTGKQLFGMFGQMKKQVMDWMYIELIVDINNIRSNIYAEKYRLSDPSENLPAPNLTNFTIHLDISAGADYTIDVDHIRFFPLQFDLTVAVYDPRTGDETERIMPNGSVLRKVYNDYGTEVASVDAEGQVEHLKSLCRSGFIFPPPQSDSNLGMQRVRRNLIFASQAGTYERFDKYSLRTSWDLEKFPDANIWSTTKATLQHKAPVSHKVSLKDTEKIFNIASSTLRFHVRFTSTASSMSLSLFNLPSLVVYDGNGTLNIASNCKIVRNLPSAGELILTMFDNTLWLWFDGVLIFDRTFDRNCRPLGSMTDNDTPWKTLQFELRGNIILKNMIMLAKPKVTMEYLNSWGDVTQILQLEDANTVLVSETIYDQLGRDAIKVKSTRIKRGHSDSPMLIYYTDFVKNRFPSDVNSIFKVGLLEGMADLNNKHDEGFPYTRTVYLPDMLMEPAAEGLPGKVFSATHGTFQTKYSRMSGLPFLELLFPTRNGYHQKVTYEPNGNIKVIVLDRSRRHVAEYVKVLGYNSTLVIYEYDKEGNIRKILPPNYHQKMRTYSKTTPWEFRDDRLTPEEKYWQQKVGTHFRYNEKQQLIEKQSPDYHTRHLMYDEIGNLKFTYHVNSIETASNSNRVANDVVYTLHSGSSQPFEIGFFKEPILVEELRNHQNGTDLPAAEYQIHQRIVHSDTHSDPTLRGNMRMFLTYDDLYAEDPTRFGAQTSPHQELLKFNAANHVVMKTSNAIFTENLSYYRKHYIGNQLTETIYPSSTYARFGRSSGTFTVTHGYNNLGKLSHLGTRENRNQIIEVEWNAAGQISKEMIDPVGVPVHVRYEYDSPGQLRKIQSPQLTQSLTFVDGGYGQGGFGHGTIMSNIMNASWADITSMKEAQRSWFKIPDRDFRSDKIFYRCIQALKRIGVIDRRTSIPKKFLTSAIMPELPLVCNGEVSTRLMELVALYLPPTSYYGHRYSYGPQRELTKAKFFGDESDARLDPLQIKSFSQLSTRNISSADDANRMWDTLIQNRFIIASSGNSVDKEATIGKQGDKPIFQYSELKQDLMATASINDVYTEPIMRLLLEFVNSNATEFHSIEKFKEIFLNWHGYYDVPTATLFINNAKRNAAKIYEMLVSKKYTDKNLIRILSPAYITALADFQADIQNITSLLTTHFAAQIGRNIFDYESFEIDPNGNQRVFYRGFNRYELEYAKGTNRVTKLTVKDPVGKTMQQTDFQYDNRGNMIKAGHKGIQLIKYHPITGRPVLIELLDGRRILLRYDGQGERLIKRVFGPKNHLISETKYLRDENGRVLMDKLTQFDTNGNVSKQLETTYLYGPRQTIIGFLRNGLFYRVFTDHAGSPRLITQGGNVVGGYDYWPYGELLRSFGDEDAQLVYLFTNQEYDVETGLYNFHARMYDPVIGRFLQPDPKEQYFSPYIYAGNSPVSMVDQDGEFFLELFMILGAVVGGYLAAAAANGQWNPVKWNWVSPTTWLAIIGGAISGAMLPYSIPANISGASIAIAFGAAGSYLFAAKANGSFNPLEWDWKHPKTYNAFLDGFATGVSVVPKDFKVSNATKMLKELGKTGQKMWKEIAFATVYAFVKGGLKNGFEFWEWDWKNPATYVDLMNDFNQGRGFAELGMKPVRYISKIVKGEKQVVKIMDKLRGNALEFLKDAFKDIRHPLWEAIGKGALAFVSNGLKEGWDISKWSWHSVATYESFINSYKMPREIIKMKGMFKDYNEFRRNWKQAISMVEKDFKVLEYAKKIHNTIVNFTKQIGYIVDLCRLKDISFPHCKSKAMRYAALLLKGLKHQDFLKNEEFDEFAFELGNIMRGLFAGSTIYPTNLADLTELIDCKDIFEATQLGVSYEECSIGSTEGIVKRHNRELINQLFVASKVYQSKTQFVEVHQNTRVEEYPDQLLHAIKDIRTADENISFMLGLFYNSLLNNVHPSHSTAKLKKILPLKTYVIVETNAALNLDLIHMAVIRNERLYVRTAAFTTQSAFMASKNAMRDYIISKQFHCQLPEGSPSISKVQAESFVVSTGDNTQMFIITPDYKLSPCTGNHVRLVAVPKPNQNLPGLFSKIYDNSIPPKVQKIRYEAFLAALSIVQQDPLFQKLSTNSNFFGFTKGFLHGNVKKSFDIIFKENSNLDNDSLLVVPTRISTVEGIPLILSSKTDVLPLLYVAGQSTLSKNALVGKFGQTNGYLSSRLEILPEYTGIYNNILGNLNHQGLENIVQYVYYNLLKENGSLEKQQDHEGNSHAVSNFFLGELVAYIGSGDDIQTYVYAPVTEAEQERLKHQRIFILSNNDTGEAVVINIIESSKMVNEKIIYDPNVDMDIPSLPSNNWNHVRICRIELNTNSKGGWANGIGNPGGINPEEVFLQGLDISTITTSLPTDDSSFIHLQAYEESMYPWKLSFDKINFAALLSKLEDIRLDKLITKTTDFEALIAGSLMGAYLRVKSDVDGMSLELRNVLLEGYQNDNIVAFSLKTMDNQRIVVPSSEQLLVSNLKVSHSSKDNFQSILSDTIQESKSFQCSNEGRLESAFKLLHAPAVYISWPSENSTQCIIADMNPEALSNLTCQASDEPLYEFHEKAQYTKGNYEYAKEKFGSFFGYKRKQAILKDTHTDGCHLGAWVSDKGYSLDGITCKSGNSQVAVFRHIQDNDVVTSSSRGRPFSLVGDNYKSESCKAISWNGQPSVACEGEKTTLIYRPYYQMRIFDELDSNIMLGRVLIHLGSKVWSFVRRSNEKPQSGVHIVTEEQLKGWENSVMEIREMIEKIKNNPNENQWALSQLQETEDQVNSIRTGSMKASLDLLEEIAQRLDALKEDIAEIILFSRAEKLYDEAGKNPEGTFRETSTYNGYTGVQSNVNPHGVHWSNLANMQ